MILNAKLSIQMAIAESAREGLFRFSRDAFFSIRTASTTTLTEFATASSRTGSLLVDSLRVRNKLIVHSLSMHKLLSQAHQQQVADLPFHPMEIRTTPMPILAAATKVASNHNLGE